MKIYIAIIGIIGTVESLEIVGNLISFNYYENIFYHYCYSRQHKMERCEHNICHFSGEGLLLYSIKVLYRAGIHLNFLWLVGITTSYILFSLRNYEVTFPLSL